MSNDKSTNSTTYQRSKLWWLLVLLGIFGLAIGIYVYSKNRQPEPVKVLTRDGVVTQIKELSRLQTVTFGVDTVITSQKQGSWQSLWQDKQKGLFVAHGQVNAGIDLTKLTVANVKVSPRSVVMNEGGTQTQNQTVEVTSDADLKIDITLPAAEIFEVYLEDIEVYDLKTGLFGIMKTDPIIFEKAQDAGKVEVLKMACKGDVLKIATDNAQKQVAGLFGLTGAEVTVKTTPAVSCYKNFKK